jgi:regulation of enolase protein 1 (concanavalin A-like superfamily)
MVPILLFALLAAETPVLKGVPAPLRWRNSPVAWSAEGGDTLSITAGKATDWFISPFDGKVSANSPMLLFQPADDFVLRAKVTVGFRSQWDAGVLVVYADEKTWAKLCFELSPRKEPTIVTVVTRALSDDSNSIPIAGDTVYLQIAKQGQAIVFYASTDGRSWKMIRAFTLGTVGLRAGFSAQSPTGESCHVVFREIRYSPRRISNVLTGE